jgi:hypothetical protein
MTNRQPVKSSDAAVGEKNAEQKDLPGLHDARFLHCRQPYTLLIRKTLQSVT